MRFWADTTPLRDSREFRLLYFGNAVSELGRQFTVVALPFQVYVLTESSLLVGLVSLIQVLPLIIGSLGGGTIADAVDRRKLLMVLQVVLAASLGGLAVNSMQDESEVWLIFALAAVMALFFGADSPTRKATVPRLVADDQVSAAFALIQVVRQTVAAVGPALAGLVIVAWGPEAAFWINAGTFLIALFAVWRMQNLPPEEGAGRPGLTALAEGISFLRRRPLLITNFALDLNAMVFAMPRALFPEIGTGVLGGSAATVGYLYAAPGAGALIGALTSGWVGGVRRQGRAVMISVAVWGLAMVAFGLSRSVLLALLALGIAGLADVVSAVFRTTILQLAVPDRLRGRLSAVHTSVVTAGPRIGDAQAGAVASVVGAPLAVTAGGAVCVLGVLVIGRLVPEYWRFDVHQHARGVLDEKGPKPLRPPGTQRPA